MNIQRAVFSLVILISTVVAPPVRAAEITLVPVGASVGQVVNGEAIVPSGGARVTLEIRVSGWSPDVLVAYQAQLDSTGFTSGSFGSLSVPNIPIACVVRDDCVQVSGSCGQDGFCVGTAAFFVDTGRADFAFAGQDVIVATNITQPDILVGGVMLVGAVADPGVPRYAATLVLDVSPDASGTFTVGFIADPSQTFLVGSGNLSILPLNLGTARINVIDDCNGNGTPDDVDISSGTSNDCNANGLPDECEADCNGNGFADDCDISAGTSTDCNLDEIPDECQPGDCNGNGTLDVCDISAGTSTDCNMDGVPDECELIDCNANGTLDSCDIADGVSVDANGNGVPDECELTTMAMIPVSAEGVHFLSPGEITVPGGGRVTLEIRIADWDLDGDGVPLLQAYQARINSTGFSSGTTGLLSVPDIPIPCTADVDCELVSGFCDQDGFCFGTGAFFVDTGRADFAFAGQDVIVATNITQPDILVGGVMLVGGVADPGVPRYAATLVLDVSPDASGTFTVGFIADPSQTFLVGSGNLSILPLNLGTARINVIDDCNDNGLPDTQDLAGGTSLDCNGNAFPDECDISFGVSTDCDGNDVPDECQPFVDCNANGVKDFCDIASGASVDFDANGIPDECETTTPRAVAAGGRYLQITPAPGTESVALLVTSPDFPCLFKYAALSSVVARLVDAPVFALPVEWGMVEVADLDVVPGTTYEIQTDFGGGVFSGVVTVTTPIWGDTAGPFANGRWQPPDGLAEIIDVVAVIDAFRNAPGAPPLSQVDLNPAFPDRIVDIVDAVRALDGFRGRDYPFAAPCVSK